VVRDLDLLRRAVGDDKLTYLGFSYGSYLGTTYANLFPQKVRALVIDGVLDPRLWSSGTQVVSDRVATAEEFAEFLRLCDEAGDACALSAPGGASARYEALANALLRTPLLQEDGSLYTYDFLIADTTSAMYVPEIWGIYAELFDSLADAVLGDTAAVQRAAATRRAIEQRLQQARPQREEYDNFVEGYYGNQCSDTGYPRSFAAFHAVGEFAEAGSIFGPYWWWVNAGCANWPVAADRYIGPWTARTSAPVLVVGNYFDGVTDYNGAVATSRLLKNGRLLSYAGWGHTAFERSECVTQYVVDYLLDGSLPPVGTVCPANPNPFVTVAERRTAPRLPTIGLPPSKPSR
jgi:pimeloyl-ACP methyl ester carboxylesterase